MFTIKINNKEYNVRDAINVKSEYNEQLDSAIIILETKDEELDIAPYDSVLILENGNQILRMLVDNFIYNEVALTPYIKREYQINLFSETKALEKITLPDLSITKSLINGRFKSVYDYIFQYCATYLPKIKVRQNNSWNYEAKYLIDEEVKNKFSAIECPEFSWNSPTLREVLNDLMMVADCLCVVNNNVISFYDITKKGVEIDLTKISYRQKSMSSGDYNSDLTITMKNSIGESLMRTTEYKSLRSDSGEITTDNASFITQYPIYNIRKLIVCGWIHNGLEKLEYVEMNITDYVKEKEVYETLSTRTISDFDNKKNTHQIVNLVFKRGENKITGFGEGWFYLVRKVPKITLIMMAKREELDRGVMSLQMDLRDLMFKIEYDAITEKKMHVGRYLPLKNEGLKSFDNQSSSYVDVQQQALFEYSKVNRLSNDILIIHAIYRTMDEVPELSDTIGDYVLFNREINLYDNYIVFKGTLTRDYILRNYFTGVQAKRRSWQIVSGKDALTRYDVTKYYLEFSKIKKHEIIENFNYDIKMFSALLDENTALNYYRINHCIAYTMDEDENRYPPLEVVENIDYNGEGYELDLGVELQGKSICLNVGFNDNYSVDTYAYLDDRLYRNGIYKYTNEHGEFNTLNLKFLIYLNPTDDENLILPEDGTIIDGLSHQDEFAEIARRKPLIKNINNEWILMNVTIPNYFKDNAEIIRQTIQFEYCSDTRDIIVGDKFIQYQQFLTIQSPQLFIVTSNNQKYDLYSNIGLGDVRSDLKLKISYRTNSVVIQIVDANDLEVVEEVASWGIVDSNNNLILGVNGDEFNVYMNLLVSRDDNIYDDIITQVRIGKSNRLIYPDESVTKPSIKLPHKEINVNTLIKPKF